MRVASLSRRRFLRGVGATIALPWLESLGAAPAVQPGLPRRLVFVYVPNGINMEDWTPAGRGTDFELPYILQPLAPVGDRFQVLSGLAHDKARPNGDGAGDHARAAATFLTGCQARKTAGSDICVGVSVDQVAAAAIGDRTRLPSLELGCDAARLAGSCDSGYSCAYQFNLSWITESTPMPPEVNPRLVFERLFGDGSAPRGPSEAEIRRRCSVLDAVREDARDLQARLGANDRRKLEEYLTSVREVERRIERDRPPPPPPENLSKPEGIPRDYPGHLGLMYDLLALALTTDSTRVATFLTAHDGSNRPYPFLDVREGHHDLSHHGNDPEKKRKLAVINRFHVEHFARFLERLKASAEGEGTVLDQCMIVFGGGISDPNRHRHDDLPVLLAGGGGGSLTPGRHVVFPRETPMSNLYVTLLDRIGVTVDRFGDSNGRLEDV